MNAVGRFFTMKQKPVAARRKRQDSAKGKAEEKNRKSSSGSRYTVNRIPLVTGIGVLLVCISPAFFMNTLFGYFPLLFLLSFALFSFLHGRILAGKVITGGKEQHFECMRGDEIEIEQSFQNLSFLPVPSCEAHFVTTDLDGNPRSENVTLFSLGAREKRGFHFRVRFDHVGEYGFYLKELRIEGMLGIVSFIIPGNGQKMVEVMPKIHNISAVDLSGTVRNESMEARHRSSAESIDYSGVREYDPGDPIKLIHWKLSSHTGEYVTRTMESYGNHALTIVPGFSAQMDTETRMALFDTIVECSASLACLAQEEGMDTSFLLEEESGEAGWLRPASGEIPQELLKTDRWSKQDSGQSGIPNRSLYSRLEKEAARRYSSDHTAVCTSQIDAEIASCMRQMRHSGRTVMLFLAIPETAELSREEQTLIRTLSGDGISCWLLRSADEIDRVVGM